MDVVAEVLRSVRLSGGIFLDAYFSHPWCVTSKITPEDCRPVLATPAQVIAYHFIIEGRVLLAIDGGRDIEVHAGEVVLLPRNDGHTLASARGIAAISADDLIQPSQDGGLARIFHGGGGEPTRLVCGFLGSEEAFNPLIAALPPVLKIDVRSGTSGDWIEASVKFAASELAEGRFASSNTMSRLSELLLGEAIRRHVSTLDENQMGWLKGLRDPQIGRALALIHANLGSSWSASRLAKEVAMSRSAFTERFTRLVGLPPIRYLTMWRLQKAKHELRETNKTISQLAHSLGYESEEAFSRAFRREFGVPPTRWRDERQGR